MVAPLFSSTQTIFRDIEILSSGFLPGRLPARDKEVVLVSRVFAPFLGVSPHYNLMIYGMTGCGKSACLRYVTEQFERASIKKKRKYPFIHKIECKTKMNEIDILLSILQKIDPARSIKIGRGPGFYYDILFQYLNDTQRGLVVEFDEIDALRNTNILYTLSRAAEMGRLIPGVHICIIGLTNDLRYIECIESRIKSSFGEHWLYFPPYNAMDLIKILSDRKSAYKKGTLSEEVISVCAAIAAQESGDARKAIDLLRTAGEIVQRGNERVVTEAHVRMAWEELEQRQIKMAIENLPQNQRLLLWIIYNISNKNKCDVTVSDITNKYMDLKEVLGEWKDIERPATHRGVFDIISTLEMLGLVERTKKSNGRGRGVSTKVVPHLSDNEGSTLQKSVYSLREACSFLADSFWIINRL